MEIKPWMLDHLDEIDGQIIRWCKPCSENRGFKVYVAIRGRNQASVKTFEKHHKWCGLDREFNIRWLELQYGQDLDDKQKLFIHQCMDEGTERDRILELINKKRQKMPAQAF